MGCICEDCFVWFACFDLAFRELSIFEHMLRELTLVGLTRRGVLREPMLRELPPANGSSA